MPEEEEKRSNEHKVDVSAFESQLDGLEEMRVGIGLMASFSWELYQANRAAGFDDDQAMAIVLSWYEDQWLNSHES